MLSVGHQSSLHVMDEKNSGSGAYLLNHRLTASGSQGARLMEILRAFLLNISLPLIREMIIFLIFK